MKKLISYVGGSTGFTLIEILVAAIIGVIATAAAVEIYVHQHKNWVIQDAVSDLQQNGRAAVDEIAAMSRQAGYGVPEGLDAIVSSKGTDVTEPDSITLVFLHEPECTTTIKDPMPQPSAELKCLGDISCYEDGQWCYIWDPNTKTGEFFVITQVQVASSHIQHNTMPLSKSYPAGSRLFTFDLYRYFVDSWSDTLHPRLMRQEYNQTPSIYADNIDNMQIQYVLTDGSVRDTIPGSRYVRVIDIEMVARTRDKDLMLHDYRYDTLSTSVVVRNLSF
jgi:prepilin-type N-terminal cleavage/methylation domain-containing protein